MTSRLAAGLVAATTVVVTAGVVVFVLDLQASRRALHRAHIHLERGIELYHRGALTHAEAELRQALRTDPKAWKAPYYTGLIQLQLRRYDLAIPYLERALTLNPAEPRIANALGVVYYRLDRLDMAKGYFVASLDLDPTNADAKGLLESMTRLQRRAAQAVGATTD